MKRLLLFVLLLMIAPMEVFAAIPERPTTSGFVFDYQNVIDDEIEKEINDIAGMLDSQNKMQLFILTVPTIGDVEPYEYGVQVIRQWGIGQAEINNGMLIFVTTDQGAGNNAVRIATGQGLEGNYPDGKVGRLLDDYMLPHLKEGNYTSAFANVVDAIRLEEKIDYEWAALSIVSDKEQDTVEEGLEPWTGENTFYTIVFILLFLFGVWSLFKGDNGTGGSGSSDSDNSYDGSNDSFSGGGGDSAGGGSDRNF